MTRAYSICHCRYNQRFDIACPIHQKDDMKDYDFISNYLNETARISRDLPMMDVVRLIKYLSKLKSDGGRLFILGNGGSAANASHAVNDFRKLCGIEAHTPTDNVAELTARINDDGWDYAFKDWLDGFKPTPNDIILVLSVGGGALGTSMNIVNAISHDVASERVRSGGCVLGIVGQAGGYTAEVANACVVLPTTSTPHVEEFQSILLHLIVNHPDLCN